MTTDTETRVRSGLQAYARSLPAANRPSLDDLLSLPARPSRRPLVALAAAVVLVVAAVALLRLADDDPTPPAVRTTWEPSSPVVWPLGDDIPRDDLRSAGSAGFTYVNDVLHLGREWYFQDQEPDGDRWVQRHYGHDMLDLQLSVDLARIEGLWFVTNVSTDGGPVVTEAQVVGDQVEVEVALDRSSPAPLEIELVADDGSTLDTAEAPLEDGGAHADLTIGPDRTPAVVQVSAQIGDETAVARTIVLPASTVDSPARDLFPAFTPVSSYEDAWRYTLTHPGDPRTDWRWALTNDVSTVMTDRRPPPAPTFSDVVTRPDGLQMTGRFATADGGAGTFDLARVRPDGPWFLLSLVDDAYDVRDVDLTARTVKVAVALREDTTVAVGCGCYAPDGRPLAEVLGKAEEEFAIIRPFESNGSNPPVADVSVAFQAVDDASLFRYFDAWSP